MPAEISACCISGNLHSGTPKGSVTQVAGLRTYISPPKDGSKAKSLILITDIFGYELPNVRLVADQYAEHGYYVYIPDLCNGDYVPHGLLKSISPQTSDPKPSAAEEADSKAKVAASLMPWLERHREAAVRPLIESVVKEIRSQCGGGKLGAIGYCWGGRYSVLLAGKNWEATPVDAAVAMHPSFLAVPGEVEDANKPVCIAVGDADSVMPLDQAKRAKEILEKKGNGSEVRIYPGACHGFSIRGDQNNEEERKWKEQSFGQSIKFLNAHL